MKSTRIRGLAVAIVLLTALCSAAIADDIAAAGRQLAAKWQTAVISVQVVAKVNMSYQGKEAPTQEQKNDTIGCVIDPSGLVVTSLQETDPSGMLEEMVAKAGDKVSITAEIKDIKLIMPDGKEISAKIVLRDKDLDLAFLRPVKKLDAPMAAIDLTKAAKPALFDQLLSISRQGIVANRATAVSIDRVGSVMEKPRTLYIPDGGFRLGSAVFATDGNIVGMMVNKRLPAGSGGSDSPGEGGIQVVLPASDIADAAKQAPATADAVK